MKKIQLLFIVIANLAMAATTVLRLLEFRTRARSSLELRTSNAVPPHESPEDHFPVASSGRISRLMRVSIFRERTAITVRRACGPLMFRLPQATPLSTAIFRALSD